MFKVLNLYIIKKFITIFLSTNSLLIFIIFLSTFLNHLRMSKGSTPILYILMIAVSETPNFFHIALPFIMVLIGLIFIRNLNNTNEIDIIKASGVNIWHLCKIIFPIIFVIGIFIIFIISPIFCFIKNKNIIKFNGSNIATVEDSFWIIDKQNNIKTIIKSNDAKIHNNVIYLSNLIVFQIVSGKFNFRIDGTNAIIANGNFIINNANIKNTTSMFPVQQETYTLKTNITSKNLQNIALEPEAINIWKMYKFINNLQQLGLNTNEYKIYFYNSLIYPFMLFLMFLLGIGLALSKEKRISNLKIILFGTIIGFSLYFFTNMINAFGVSGLIPPFLTILGEVGFVSSLGLYLIINREGL